VDPSFPPELPGFASPATPTSVPPAPTYRDRSTGLQVFGVIQVILGVMAAFGIPLMLLGALMSRKVTGTAMPIGTYMLTCLTYGIASIFLITLGVGSIRARRWGYALTLIVSWLWLIIGTLATIMITAVLPAGFADGFRKAAAANPNAGTLPAGVMAVILTIIIIVFAVFFIVLPLVFVLFYRREDVKETCRRRDPVETWTDQCPLPVLAASLIFAFAAPYYMMMAVTTPLVPFFGKWLTGVPGAAGCLVLAAIDAFLAISFFRLKLVGWWVAIAALMLRMVSIALTYRRGNLLQAYSQLGWRQSQLQAMSGNPMMRGNLVLWWSVVYILVFAVYIFWTKRYFTAGSAILRPPMVADFTPISRHHGVDAP
jgi:uncharacterized membrane protein